MEYFRNLNTQEKILTCLGIILFAFAVVSAVTDMPNVSTRMEILNTAGLASLAGLGILKPYVNSLHRIKE